jgi:LacI family transcriptional regulator
MAVRLKDIAAELGVSLMTVSKVLRGKPDVGEHTRQRVLRRLEELKYQPNIAARALASGRTFTVGLIVPDLVHSYFAEFARSLAAELRLSQYAVLLASSEEQPEVERNEVATLLQRGVDVLLLASCRTDRSPATDLYHGQKPILLIDRELQHVQAPFLGSDDLAIGSLAAEHLIEIGCKRIAHIGGKGTSPARGREKGLRETLHRAGQPIPERWILRNDRLDERGEHVGALAMHRLMKDKQRPDGVFCYNDVSAIGAIRAALSAGLRVPQDVAILGCGNSRYADFLQIPLSSIDQNTEELGRIAGQFSIRLSEGESKLPEATRLTPRLVVRSSTQPTKS